MKLSPSLKQYFYPPPCHDFWSSLPMIFFGAHVCQQVQHLGKTNHSLNFWWKLSADTLWRTSTFTTSCILFTCGRRPAGLLVTLVVVVGGGGNNFYTWAFQRAHVWLWKNQKQDPIFLFYFYFFKISKAHVWFGCPCMAKRGGSHPIPKS